MNETEKLQNEQMADTMSDIMLCCSLHERWAARFGLLPSYLDGFIRAQVKEVVSSRLLSRISEGKLAGDDAYKEAKTQTVSLYRMIRRYIFVRLWSFDKPSPESAAKYQSIMNE